MIVCIDDDSLWHHELMSSKWVGHIKEDATLSAHMLLVIARSSNTGGPVHGCRVCAALCSGLSLEPDVATLAPARSPAVPHNPEVTLCLVSAVTNQLDCMVQGNVVVKATPSVDASSISSPATGVHSHGKGSVLGKVGHHGILVIGGQGVVASNPNNWSSVHKVIHTVASLCGGAGGVGVVILSDVSEELDVSVS